MSGLRSVTAKLAAAPAAIAYLGHSVTAQKDGYRPHLHAGLVALFGQPHRAVNAGFGGVGSIASVCTMDDLVIRHRPTLCFIECMTGDIGVGLRPNSGAALEGMLRKLAAIDCAACFLNLPRQDGAGADAAAVGALYARIAAHHGIGAIDLGPDLVRAGPEFFRDVVHTTAAGGMRTAALILERLKPLFTSAGSPRTAAPLFDKDYASATVVPVGTDALREPAACTQGRFRLVYPTLEIGPDNEFHFHSESRELLGLLIVAGPNAGPALIDGQAFELRDRWSHYERLHAVVFDAPYAAGRRVAIAPMQDARPPAMAPPRLKLIGFLVRDV